MFYLLVAKIIFHLALSTFHFPPSTFNFTFSLSTFGLSALWLVRHLNRLRIRKCWFCFIFHAFWRISGNRSPPNNRSPCRGHQMGIMQNCSCEPFIFQGFSQFSHGNATFCTGPPRRTGDEPEPFIARKSWFCFISQCSFRIPRKPFIILETVHSSLARKSRFCFISNVLKDCEKPFIFRETVHFWSKQPVPAQLYSTHISRRAIRFLNHYTPKMVKCFFGNHFSGSGHSI